MDEAEFFDDLKRFKYLKRLFNKYQETGEIKERLVLNHLMILYNLFGGVGTTKMLFFKLRDYDSILKPFLILSEGLDGPMLQCCARPCFFQHMSSPDSCESGSRLRAYSPLSSGQGE